MNLGKIKSYAKVVLQVVTKAGNILKFVDAELDGTPLSLKLAEILPKVQGAIDTVQDALTKILEFFGEDVTSEVSALSGSTIEAELSDLEVAVAELKAL
tara:strand:+ start:5363 stop:5659 length:297 start_codon:yes stop_codon:yes gene_type:complete